MDQRGIGSWKLRNVEPRLCEPLTYWKNNFKRDNAANFEYWGAEESKKSPTISIIPLNSAVTLCFQFSVRDPVCQTDSYQKTTIVFTLKRGYLVKCDVLQTSTFRNKDFKTWECTMVDLLVNQDTSISNSVRHWSSLVNNWHTLNMSFLMVCCRQSGRNNSNHGDRR